MFPFLTTGGQYSAALQPRSPQSGERQRKNKLITPTRLTHRRRRCFSTAPPAALYYLSGWTLTFPLLLTNMLIHPPHTHTHAQYPEVSSSRSAVPARCRWRTRSEDKRTYNLLSRNVFPFFSLLHPSLLNCLLTFVVLPPGCML